MSKFWKSWTDLFNLHYFLWGNLTRKSNRLLERIVFDFLGSTVFNNQIFVNIISQICKHMIEEYSLGYYSTRHVLNK
jgi:hypothetical protein